MSITAGALLSKVSKTLQDDSNVRWPVVTELIGWLDSAQREIALLKPMLFVSATARKLTAGTRQTLADASVGLADITRNMGTTGTTPGRTIQVKSREVMDVMLPDWHNTAALAEVMFFFRDPKDPKSYYVWPPQPAVNQGYVEEICYIAPTPIVDANSLISADDIYENVLVNLVLSRAYGKDSESQLSAELAKMYRSMAMETLGLRSAVEVEATPKG